MATPMERIKKKSYHLFNLKCKILHKSHDGLEFSNFIVIFYITFLIALIISSQTHLTGLQDQTNFASHLKVELQLHCCSCLLPPGAELQDRHSERERKLILCTLYFLIACFLQAKAITNSNYNHNHKNCLQRYKFFYCLYLLEVNIINSFQNQYNTEY